MSHSDESSDIKCWLQMKKGQTSHRGKSDKTCENHAVAQEILQVKRSEVTLDHRRAHVGAHSNLMKDYIYLSPYCAEQQ